MKNSLYLKITAFFILFFTSLLLPTHTRAAFRFVSWADTQGSESVLAALSNQVVNLNINPKLTIYPGDLEDSGFTLSGITLWKDAINGGSSPGNGIFDITLPVRGNHDRKNTSDWQTYFDMRTTAHRVGATNYKELNTDLTYSFDYENSRFIGVDVLGTAPNISSSQVSWIDDRLTDAELPGSNLTHSFIYFHGPIYWVASQNFTHDYTDNSPLSNLIRVINKHPIVSATFHGHEHLFVWTHINRGRITTTTHEYEQFVTSAAGPGPWSCKPERYDWCMDDKNSFTAIDVDGNNFTVRVYKLGQSTPAWTKTFSKSDGGTPPPTTTPTPTLGVPGDGNNDGQVDGQDFIIWLTHYGQNVSGVSNGDYNDSGKVEIGDYVVWIKNYAG